MTDVQATVRVSSLDWNPVPLEVPRLRIRAYAQLGVSLVRKRGVALSVQTRANLLFE